MMIAFSPTSVFQVRLPAGDDSASLLNLIISIRDISDCTTEYNMSAITVLPDNDEINDLINDIQNPTNNPTIQLLASGNQNLVGQILTSVSQQFNKMNSDNLNKAVSGKSYIIINNQR